MFAALARQRQLNQTADQADWLIGVGLFLPGVNAKALRSMLQPGTAYDDPRLGKDPQVGSMTDFVDTTEDNGGVHLNSGIPNRAFALAARALGGQSWEKAGRVWYETLTGGELGAEAQFVDFAAATVSAAHRLFPDDPSVADRVEAAWRAVAVITTTAAASAPAPLAAGPTAHTVQVRRSGGVTGVSRAAEIDLDTDPVGPEVRGLLAQVAAPAAGVEDAPDRFTYSVRFGDTEFAAAEQNLTPELDRIVRLVLKHGRQT